MSSAGLEVVDKTLQTPLFDSTKSYGNSADRQLA